MRTIQGQSQFGNINLLTKRDETLKHYVQLQCV